MSKAKPTALWRNRIVGYETVAVDQIVANPRNFRTHPKEQIEALAGVLEEIGIVQNVIINRTTGYLLDGHARVMLALKKGQPTVESTIVELTEEEEALTIATLDRIAHMAGIDRDALEALLQDASSANAAVQKLLDDMAASVGLAPRIQAGDGGDDFDPTPDDGPTRTNPGEIWLIGGRHRLLVGDATSADDVARLMAGETAQMAFTDPPWNVAIGLDSNPRHRQREGLTNDNLSPEDFAAFIEAFAAQLLSNVSGDVYVVLGASEWPTLDRSLRGVGFHWSATIIWVKDLFVLGRSKYHRRYEPLWYGWAEKGTSSYNNTIRDADDVWEIPRPRVSDEHPTMKPIELVERAILHSSMPDGILFDPFLGSGTSLIAAHRTGRRCFGMEIAPKYADVILRRAEAEGLDVEREG